MTHRRGLWIGTALCAALVATAPAQAGEVLLVDGQRVVRVDDPRVPERAQGDLGRAPAVATAGRAASRKTRRAARRARRATARALRVALARGAISPARYRGYRRAVARARAVERRLRGARRRELGSVIALVDGMALRRQLTASRMPAVFLILRRNTQYWPHKPFPRDRDQLMFRGSRLLFEYYAGNGLQLQPLVNFKQANLMHGACVKDTGVACDRAGLAQLLDELLATAARRGGFETWEYYFRFGGGSPPWISGMAQATAIQALARASQLLGERGYLEHARAAFGAFRAAPPVGIRTAGPFGGTHYLQYSFAPGLYIINAFLQSLIGLYDYAEITGDATARRLFQEAEPEAREELPANDVGDWSTYSYRGAESTRGYHELLRELTASLCSRLRMAVYCETARSFLDYMTEPAEIELLGPVTATKGVPTQVRFYVSKLSAVQVTITRDGRTALDRLATFRRGNGAFTWKPGAAGTYRVRVAAKELRTGGGLRSSVTELVESFPP
jgi:D-glucuronyl C5-epimerase C-terminus